MVLKRDPSLLAGNSSLPLAMSGVSFEGATHTDERFGWVYNVFGFRHYPPTTED
jgi:hypothetical protein